MRFPWTTKQRQRPPTREARLRPEYSSQYPRIKPGVWFPIRTILRKYREYWTEGAGRLPAEAFEFHGGIERNPAWSSLRQRATDVPLEIPRPQGPRQALVRPSGQGSIPPPALLEDGAAGPRGMVLHQLRGRDAANQPQHERIPAGRHREE